VSFSQPYYTTHQNVTSKLLLTARSYTSKPTGVRHDSTEWITVRYLFWNVWIYLNQAVQPTKTMKTTDWHSRKHTHKTTHKKDKIYAETNSISNAAENTNTNKIQILKRIQKQFIVELLNLATNNSQAFNGMLGQCGCGYHMMYC